MKPSVIYKTRPLRDKLRAAEVALLEAIELANKGGYYEPEELHESLDAIYHYCTLITQEAP